VHKCHGTVYTELRKQIFYVWKESRCTNVMGL